MKWYKMDCDAQENLDMRKMVDEWGWDWYGRYYAIVGKVGMLVTDKCQSFALQTNNGCPFPVRLLANDLGTNVERLSDFCQYLADNRLIDAEAWNTKKLIFIPKLRERADEYTKKLLTNSRHSPEQEVEVEEEVEQKKKKIKIARTKNRAPSTPEEVQDYFVEIGSTKDEADKFHNYYSANGWVQGRQGKPIVDWKAAARHWKTNQVRYANNRQGNQSGYRKSEQTTRATFVHDDEAKQRLRNLAESLKERDASRLRGDQCA